MEEELNPGRVILLSARQVLDEDNYRVAQIWVEHHMRGDWFTSRLFKLWQSCDGRNREKLAQGFPDEVGVFTWWAYGSRYSPVRPL